MVEVDELASRSTSPPKYPVLPDHDLMNNPSVFCRLDVDLADYESTTSCLNISGWLLQEGM